MTAGLSIDLDDLWSYQMIHGDAGWDRYDTYLPLVVPRVLEFFTDRELTTTWFIVGRDAARPEAPDLLGPISSAGHEVGNHSFGHEPWLHRHHRDDITRDIGSAHESIAAATGVDPQGFRGPGYAVSSEIIEVLLAAGYRYDASSLPTWIGPLARAYYFRSTDLADEERALRAELFGRWRDGIRSLRPHIYRGNGTQLLEAPVTTLPLVRIPFHFSYLLYLSGRSRRVASRYLAVALRLCHLRGIGPALLFHPLDFVDGTEVPELAFFPGMDVAAADKLELLHGFVEQIAAVFDIVPMGDYVAAVEPEARSKPVSASR